VYFIRVTRYRELRLMEANAEQKSEGKEILHSYPGVCVPPEWYFSSSPALGAFYYSAGKS
jgi:hypothetical protein